MLLLTAALFKTTAALCSQTAYVRVMIVITVETVTIAETQVTLHHLSTAPSDMNTEPSATSIATIYRTSREDGTTSNLTAVQVIMQGPCIGTGNDGSHLQDIRAVAAHSSNEKQVATCGADGVLRVWDTEIRHCVAVMRVCEKRYAQSLAYSQDAKGCVHLAVGMRGKILVLNASNQLTPGDDLPQVQCQAPVKSFKL